MNVNDEAGESDRASLLDRLGRELQKHGLGYRFDGTHVFVGAHRTPLADFEMNFGEALLNLLTATASATSDVRTENGSRGTPRRTAAADRAGWYFDRSGVAIWEKSG